MKKKLSLKIPDPIFDKLNFFERVYEVVRLIPKGRVSTYGAIAKYLGSAGSSRMVGWAMNHSHFSKEYVPAHRVVNRIGMLTGKHHFETESMMEMMLKNEDIHVENDKVVKFPVLFWDPCTELI